MPKKSSASAARANAARRSQTSSTKSAEVTLVRQPRVTAEVASAPKTAAPAPSSSTSPGKPAKSAVVPATARPRVPEVTKAPGGNKSAPSRTGENAARPAGKSQVNRVARAQASQRVRTAGQVSPEQYSYVKYDLRLIGILAAAMFLFMIILHFLLPVFLPQ
jgi:hypothetical protein